MTEKIAALILLCGIFYLACKSDAGKPEKGAATEPLKPSAAARPELFLFTVTVDNLRLREEPNLAAAIKGQLKEGEIVEGAGEISSNQDEVELRGISIKAPYIRLNKPAAGWAFGGALIQLYAGSRAGAPDQHALATLTTFLRGLNAKSLESGKKAWSYVEQHFSNASGAQADAVFILLEQFFRRMEREGAFYTLTEKINWTDQDMNAIYEGKFDPNSKPITKSLAANGFRIVTAEGSVFPIADCRKFEAFFAPKTTPGMTAYIQQRTAEQNNPMFDDGGIIITLEEVADQAVFWEKFNRENPWFPLREETRHSEGWMRMVLTNGSDNTPSFSYETDEIDGEFKNVWAYIQQKYPGTELAKSAKTIADLCAAEGWKRTKKVEAFQMEVARKFTGEE